MLSLIYIFQPIYIFHDIDLFRIVHLNILFRSKVFYLVFGYVFQLKRVLTNEEMNNEQGNEIVKNKDQSWQVVWFPDFFMIFSSI